MNKTTLTRKQKISGIITTLPFLFGILFLIIGLFTLEDIYLQKTFSLSISAIIIFSLIHLTYVLVLNKLNLIYLEFPNTKLKKVFIIFLSLFMIFLSNLLLVMGLKMNLNYWLKKKTIKNIELIVADKNISHGKASDYYIIFNSNGEKLKNKVKRKNFNSFAIGETYKASVKEGYFEGYFLTEPMKLIKE